MTTPRLSQSHSPKKGTSASYSLSMNALSEGFLQRHTMPKSSKNSSGYKNASGSAMCSEKSTKSKSLRLSDLMAAMYPGLKVGHKHCVEKVVFVPKTMGWLWNTEDTATGVPFPRGWRPGAVALGVRRKMIRSSKISEPLTTPTGSKGKRQKKNVGKPDSSYTTKTFKSSTSSIAINVPPTLCIQKEHGIYHVKMQPIQQRGKDENEEEEQPVQFKIADSVSSRSQISKSTSSSLKIEYLCTGALRKPIKKPELAEIGTQWEISDFEIKEHEKKEKNEKKESEDKKGQKKESKRNSSIKQQTKP